MNPGAWLPACCLSEPKGLDELEAVESDGWMHLGAYSAVASLLGAAVNVVQESPSQNEAHDDSWRRKSKYY